MDDVLVSGNAQYREKLFDERAPEAAARQLAVVLADAVEWHLFVLEDMQTRRVSKSRLAVQQEICDSLVFHCNDLGVEPRGLLGIQCTRMGKLIAEAGSAR